MAVDSGSLLMQHQVAGNDSAGDVPGTHSVVESCEGNDVDQVHGNHSCDQAGTDLIGPLSCQVAGIDVVFPPAFSTRFNVLLVLPRSQRTSQ